MSTKNLIGLTVVNHFSSLLFHDYKFSDIFMLFGWQWERVNVFASLNLTESVAGLGGKHFETKEDVSRSDPSTIEKTKERKQD